MNMPAVTTRPCTGNSPRQLLLGALGASSRERGGEQNRPGCRADASRMDRGIKGLRQPSGKEPLALVPARSGIWLAMILTAMPLRNPGMTEYDAKARPGRAW